MPIEWIALALKAALSGVVKPVAGKAYSAAAARVQGALSHGPLSDELERAYREGFKGFYTDLENHISIDSDARSGLDAFAGSSEFKETLVQLPYVPFPTIEIDRLRELLVNVVSAATGDDFDSAWRALGRRFERAVAADEKLSRLTELTRAQLAARDEQASLQTLNELASLAAEIARNTAPRLPDETAAVSEYRDALYQKHRYADTRGLFLREREGVAEAIELRTVFVETQLASHPEKKHAPADPHPGQPGAAAGPEAEPAGIARGDAEAPEIAWIGEILRRDRTLVLLGSPGSGKSTLLRFLALTLCRPPQDAPLLELPLDPTTLPVLLPLREFASTLRTSPNCRLETFLFARSDLDEQFLVDRLRKGEVLLLLDGLDEVFDETDRRWVSDQVWALMTRFDKSRYVLTSRPHGYQAAPLPGPIRRWQLLAFDDGQIARFFTGWFEALAREGGEAQAAETPQRRAAALTADVVARPALRALAQNPLLSTLVVLVHRSRSGHLPERRVVFYDAAVKTLAEVWERTKLAPNQLAPNLGHELPEPELLIRALAEVAWRSLHELATREIPGEALRRWLIYFLEEQGWPGEKGRIAVRHLLDLVETRTGLLLHEGADQYQFLHQSLHEHLASDYLLDRLNEADCGSVVRHYLHDTAWEEVLRLLVAASHQAQADSLATLLLDNPSSSWEPCLRRDLGFLCRCLGDKAPFGPSVRKRIVDLLVAVLGDPSALSRAALAEDAAGIDDPRLLVVFRQLAADRFLAPSAARYLHRGQARDPEALMALAKTFLAHAGRTGAGWIIELLRDTTEPQLQATFLKGLEREEDLETQAASLLCLSALGAPLLDNQAEVATNLLIRDSQALGRFPLVLVPSDWSEAIRQILVGRIAPPGQDSAAAIRVLAKLPGSEESWRAVLPCLSVSEREVRRAAVEYFRDLDPERPEARMVISNLLTDPEAFQDALPYYLLAIHIPDARESRAIGESFDRSKASRDAVVEFIRWSGTSDPELYLRYVNHPGHSLPVYMRRRLAESVTNDRAVVKRVVELMESADSATREDAINFLGDSALAKEYEGAIKTRLADPSWSVRLAAARVLPAVGNSWPQIMEWLDQEVVDSERSDTRVYLATLIGIDVANDSPASRPEESFVRLLSHDDPDVRRSLAQRLASAKRRSPLPREAIRRRLVEETDQETLIGLFSWAVREDFELNRGVLMLDVYAKIAAQTSTEIDQLFGEKIGRLAATDDATLERILAQGRSIPFGWFKRALTKTAEELDRLRRDTTPLAARLRPGV